jgi:hypothetical protein
MEKVDFGTIGALILAASGVAGLVFGVKSSKRADREKTEKDAQALARIESAVGTIKDGINEIKRDMGTHREWLQDHEKRLIRIETRNETKGD